MKHPAMISRMALVDVRHVVLISWILHATFCYPKHSAGAGISGIDDGHVFDSLPKSNIQRRDIEGVAETEASVSDSPAGCRSGSIPYCGELETPGPHCIQCLRALWEEVGCEPEGTRGPDNAPANINTWNGMSVVEALRNMREFPLMADIEPLFCYGPERNTMSASETSGAPVTSRDFIRASIWIPGGSSGNETGGELYNSTDSNSDLPNETTQTTIICVSVAGGLLALGSALAIYGIYRNRKKKRSQSKGTSDDVKMT